MPKIYVLGDHIWAVPPHDDRTAQQQLTYELAHALPDIGATVMTDAGFPTNPEQIVVYCPPPMPLVINGDNLEITFCPNFTPARQDAGEQISMSLIDLVSEFVADWVYSAHGEAGTFPTIAYDVDLTMGSGGLTDKKGHLNTTWP